MIIFYGLNDITYSSSGFKTTNLMPVPIKNTPLLMQPTEYCAGGRTGKYVGAILASIGLWSGAEGCNMGYIQRGLWDCMPC
jgi:hypothetical protein